MAPTANRLPGTSEEPKLAELSIRMHYIKRIGACLILLAISDT